MPDIQDGGVGGGTGVGGQGGIGTNVLPPFIGMRVTSINNGAQIVIQLFRTETNPFLSASLAIRIYYVSALSASASQMNSDQWFEFAQLVKRYVADLNFAGTTYMQLTLPATEYVAGGWFYVVQVSGNGIELQGASPVPLIFTQVGISIPANPTEQVKNVSVTQRNVNGLIELTFGWQLPNVAGYPDPLGPIAGGFVQIWIYNYKNKGDWRQFDAFHIQAKSLQFETGKKLYYPDFDGLHNVVVHFVSGNANGAYLEPFFNLIPAPTVTLVGGIGP